MTAVWHGLMPALTRLLGYFPARRLGLGEDLPAGMALQWAARRIRSCARAGRSPASSGAQALLDRCAALQRPALLVSISDDAFATSAGTKRLLSYYPGSFRSSTSSSPRPMRELRRIGHFGFFRRAAGTALWPRLLAQLEAAQRR